MIIAGADVAGSKKFGEHRVIALVIGIEEDINSLYNKIGLPEIHMSELEETVRNQVIEKLDFKGKNILVFSLMVEKIKTVHKIHEYKKRQDPLFPVNVIFQHFDSSLLDEIKDRIEKITYRHGVGIRDLPVECENDMSNTVRTWRMQKKPMGKAYELSDAIAWCCNNDKRIKGIIRLDLVSKLRKKMEHDFKN